MCHKKGEVQRKVNIVLIDSGIDKNAFGLGSHVIQSTGFYIGHNGYIAKSINPTVKNSHGTIIAAIIQSVFREVNFIDINILDENLLTDGRILLYAMEEALLYQPEILHLSLGTTRRTYRGVMKKLVDTAIKRGINIVSSSSNDGNKSYPSHLKGVIGVKSMKFGGYKDFLYRDGFFYAPGDPGVVENLSSYQPEEYYGNSFSAGYITGKLARLIMDDGTMRPEDLKRKLKESAYK